MAFDSFMRKAILSVADNHAVASFFRKYGMKLGVTRFVAAEQLESALDTVEQLNKQGFLVTLDYLGESVTERGLAEEAAAQAVLVLKRIRERGVDANLSVKLTQLGLHLDPAFCELQMSHVLAEAERTNNFVRIDMEDSRATQITIDLFLNLLERFGADRVGLVLQSYLYRTASDRKLLGSKGANLRIVKGAYHEPKSIAYPRKSDVDASYVKLVKEHLEQGNYTAAATHDESIIAEIIQFTKKNDISKDRFEFQMLYGISTDLQHRLVKEGYRVRIYTPFGEHWYPFYTRRIAERPANLWFVIRSMLRS